MSVATATLAVAAVAMAVAACRAEPAVEPGTEDQIFGAAEPTAEEPATAEDGGVFLPADRTKERQLDRARRLVNSGNWTDAAALLDEILADDRDAFVQGDGTASTRRSIRDSAARMIESLPDPGRQAYALMVHGRAERALAEAVARDDTPGIVAVARRWFATPAGHQAALLAAFAALEADDPLAATAWLGRVAVSADAGRSEPTLTLMRAVATERAGDSTAARELLRIARARGEATARIGGRDVPLSGETGGDAAWLARIAAVRADGRGRGAGEWRQPRGDVARNAVADASRPLLVPRYRVPLTRHPEESRLLERHRRAAAAEGELVMPAGGPLAVRGTVVLHTPLGILGIDFETGKRLWLRSGVSAGASAAATGDAWLQASLGRVFDDATSGGLSSDGTLVFAVESHADALTPPPATVESRLGSGDAAGWTGGNSLAAYDVAANGRLRWRLPDRDSPGASTTWYMGAPLVVGDELFVLVEERGQVRLDVLDAERGAVKWSQPLAELDDEQSAANPESFARRLAGLSPALGEGVLVCPLGGGSVVALDVATRTLLWAHGYRLANAAAADGRRRGLGDERAAAAVRGGDPCPVIAAGRVLLSPYDADELVCLGLHDGAPAWPEPPRGRLQIAGVVAGRVVVVGRAGVEALALDTGRRLWQRPHPAAALPSGRGIVTAASLFLPYDTPEVVEIAVADGGVVGRRAARGGAVPGNLVAYRGEVISRGVDAVDVFHQQADLESRIETAGLAEPPNPWSDYWRGQLELDDGAVDAGLARLRRVAGVPAARVPPAAFADALVFGMRLDFSAAAARWREWADAAAPAASAPEVMRVAVDGFLRDGDLPNAWKACRGLLVAAGEAQDRTLISDPSDPAVEVQPDRWVRGRLAELLARADQPLRDEIAATAREVVAAAASTSEPSRRVRKLQAALDRLGDHPATGEAVAALAAGSGRGDAAAGRQEEIRRGFLGLAAAGGSDVGDAAAVDESPWPLGRISVRRGRSDRPPDGDRLVSQIVSIPVAAAGQSPAPDLAVAYDVQQRRLLVFDGCGRRLVEPLPIDHPFAAMPAMPWLGQSFPIEPSLVGRVLFVRTTSGVTAFDLAAAPGENRTLWRHGGRTDAVRDAPLVRIVAGAGGRVERNGGVPLGRRIAEPDDLATPAVVRGAPARVQGVMAAGSRSVTLLDPVSGHVLWERHGLPAVSEWIGDDEVLCGCTVDGRNSPVLSMRDGRLLHAVDVPGRRQRLATYGRRLLAIAPLDNGPIAARVRIDVVDPVDRETRPLGEFSGNALAAPVGGDHLAVVEPNGGLTLVDLRAGGVSFRTHLPGMTGRPGYLHASAWQDRYLVFVGGDDEPAFGTPDDGGMAPLTNATMVSESTPPLSGAVWAVDRADGGMLWPVPATVSRHCLHLTQPAALPVLLFCRQTRAGGDGGRPQLSLLCLDKRTGHAVFEEDRIQMQPHMFVGCEVTGSPVDHTVTLRGVNASTRPITLEFTGEPMAPRPPFQAQGRPPSSRRGIEGLERSLDAAPAGVRPNR